MSRANKRRWSSLGSSGASLEPDELGPCHQLQRNRMASPHKPASLGKKTAAPAAVYEILNDASVAVAIVVVQLARTHVTAIVIKRIVDRRGATGEHRS